MDALVFLLLVLLVCAVTAGRWWLYYPARDWRHMFGREHRDGRRALKKARKQRKTVLRRHKQARNEIHKKARRTGKTRQKNIRELEQSHENALLEGRGGDRGGLGRLHLYDHELVVLRTDPTDDEPNPDEVDVIRLAELTITPGPLPPNGSYIAVNKQGSPTYPVNFPSSYDQYEVQNLVIAITDQITWDREDRARRHAEAEAFAADIRVAKADKAAAVKAAQEELRELLRAQATDPDFIQANHVWDKACDAWEALTGRRPRR